MDAFTQSYVTAALWTETDDAQNYSVADIAPPSLRKMEGDCRLFQQQNAALLVSFYAAGFDSERAGHDFWLTRNGHGSGFWDEDAPDDIRTGLTRASHAFGEQDLYVGDDKKIYVVGGESDQRGLPLQADLLKKGFIREKEVDWLKAAARVRGYAMTGVRRTLQPWDWHALNLALQTMRMPAAMQGVMGGPNEAEARRVIRRITGKNYEQLPESMRRGRAPKSIPASLRKKDRDMKQAESKSRVCQIHKMGIPAETQECPWCVREDNAYDRGYADGQIGAYNGADVKPPETANRKPSPPPGMPDSLENRSVESVPDATGDSRATASARPRLAGAKYGGGVTPELIRQAKELIDADDPIIYDVAADRGQIVDNVREMSWFVRDVAAWLADDEGLGIPERHIVDDAEANAATEYGMTREGLMPK